SISENAGRMGIPLPQPLINAIETLGEKNKQSTKKGK
ncbi:phage holin family protein, partial [Bacillus cereus]|nr:phage holin family protein [Bacillus cereus]